VNPRPLLSELKTRALVCDGAMGTQLMARGMQPGGCPETWNVDRPTDVQAIHQAYLSAGVDLLTTNTFGGCGLSLERHGLQDRVEQLNSAGAQLARRAIGDACAWVLGDIGPFGGFLEPVGDALPVDVQAAFVQQATALARGGADAFIIETMSDPSEMALAVASAKQAAPLAVIATYAFEHGDGVHYRTMTGADTDAALGAAADAGADIVGANCGTSMGLDDYARLTEALVRSARGLPVILQPNAGSPGTVDGKLVYPATPADMAGLAGRLLSAGVRIIGGCCGTTPAHLAAMAKVVKG